MSKIHEFLPNKRTRKTPHRQATDIKYLASFLDGYQRHELEMLAEYGMSGSQKRAGRDAEHHMNAIRRCVQNALAEMRSAMDGDFEAEAFLFHVEFDTRERFVNRLIKGKDRDGILYVSSYLDKTERERLDAFAESNCSFKLTAQQIHLSVAYLRHYIPRCIRSGIRRMCEALGGNPFQLGVSQIIATRERHNMAVIASNNKIEQLKRDLALEKTRYESLSIMRGCEV